MAEREGFEPPEPCGSVVFKTTAIDHSATSPWRAKTLGETPFLSSFLALERLHRGKPRCWQSNYPTPSDYSTRPAAGA
jgi:hypothetical protein